MTHIIDVLIFCMEIRCSNLLVVRPLFL